MFDKKIDKKLEKRLALKDEQHPIAFSCDVSDNELEASFFAIAKATYNKNKAAINAVIKKKELSNNV